MVKNVCPHMKLNDGIPYIANGEQITPPTPPPLFIFNIYFFLVFMIILGWVRLS